MKPETVREYFERNQEVSKSGHPLGQAILESDQSGPVLWIEKHERGLTIVDCNSSVEMLNYRDESDEDVEAIRQSWLNIFRD